MKTVRIGAAQGFWGDSPYPALDVVRYGDVQYLCGDALAELTLAILQKSRQKNPAAGWVSDLTNLYKLVLPVCREKGIKIITNHGGLNPLGAADEIRRIAAELGLTGFKVGVVTGDDVFDRLPEIEAKYGRLDDMDGGNTYADIKERLLFANVYLGAQPIVEALKAGADVIVTGRCADSALFLAPMVYELGWEWDDWDKIASGVLLGHLMECAAQPTGGNFNGDWWNVEHMERPGYPIAEVSENGEAIITKAPGTGGLVSVETVTEQLVYEVLDPRSYITPDVIADFTSVRLSDAGENKVLVQGVKGVQRPEQLKVSTGYHYGWTSSGMIWYAWPDTLKKAKRAEEIIRRQMDSLGIKPQKIYLDYFGLNALTGSVAEIPDEDTINELGFRMAILTQEKKEADIFPRIFVPLSLNGPPTAVGGRLGGIDRAKQAIRSWSTLIPREEAQKQVQVVVQEV